jgi:hypothetical protein
VAAALAAAMAAVTAALPAVGNSSSSCCIGHCRRQCQHRCFGQHAVLGTRQHRQRSPTHLRPAGASSRAGSGCRCLLVCWSAAALYRA